MKAALLLAILVACEAPPELAVGVCGNGVIEGAEQCEGTPPSGTCEQCRYVCPGAVACPFDYGCGIDGQCRQASGTFVEAPGSPFATPPFDVQNVTIAVGDLDCDAQRDLVVGGEGIAQINYGIGGGSFGEPKTFTSFVVKLARVVVGDFDGDRCDDLAFSTGINTTSNVGIALGSPDHSLPSVPLGTFPESPLPPLLGNPDVWIPMRYAIPDPHVELLHVLGTPSAIRLEFEQDDPAATTIAGNHDAFKDYGNVARFAVGNLIESSPGDEVVIAFNHEPQVRIYTLICPTPCNRHGGNLPKLGAPIVIDLDGNPIEPPQIVDVDGNGHLDILATVQEPGVGQSTIAIPWNGNMPAAPITLDVPCDPRAAGDLGGDARAELVCLNGIWQRQANGTYARIALTAGLEEAVIVDFNRDGRNDVVGIPADHRSISVHLDLDGAFGTYNIIVPNASGLRAGDLDGDRVTDLAFIDDSITDRATVKVIFGVTNGLPDKPQPIATWEAVRSIEIGVLGDRGFPDLDGTPDLVIGSQSIGRSNVTLLQGDAGRALRSFDGNHVAYYPSLVAGNFSNVVTPQLVFGFGSTTPTDNQMTVLAPSFVDGVPSGRPLIPTPIYGDDPVPDGNHISVVADRDGDGLDEVVVFASPYQFDDTRTQIYAGMKPEPQWFAPQPLASQYWRPRVLHAADADSDGTDDIVAVFEAPPCAPGCDGAAAIVVFWGGRDWPPELADIRLFDTSNPLDAVFMELDPDSPGPELLVASSTAINVFTRTDREFHQAGEPLFTFTSQLTDLRLLASDLDRDGVDDLAILANGELHVLRGVPR